MFLKNPFDISPPGLSVETLLGIFKTSKYKQLRVSDFTPSTLNVFLRCLHFTVVENPIIHNDLEGFRVFMVELLNDCDATNTINMIFETAFASAWFIDHRLDVLYYLVEYAVSKDLDWITNHPIRVNYIIMELVTFMDSTKSVFAILNILMKWIPFRVFIEYDGDHSLCRNLMKPCFCVDGVSHACSIFNEMNHGETRKFTSLWEKAGIYSKKHR